MTQNLTDLMKSAGVKNSLISCKPLRDDGAINVFAINPEDYNEIDHPVIKFLIDVWKEGKKQEKTK